MKSQYFWKYEIFHNSQKLKAHSTTMVDQTQELFSACLHNTASQIENTDSLFQDIQTCTVPVPAADADADFVDITTPEGEDSQVNQVIDSKVDEVRIGSIKTMHMNDKEVVSDLFEDKDHAEYDYLTVY